MSVLFYLVFACLAVVSYGERVSPTLSILGGQEAQIGEFPYMAFLRVNGKPRCGGSIIDRRYILTAAHCMNKPGDTPKNFTVHVGMNFLNETGDVYTVAEIIPHLDFVPSTKNDIGLLRLEKDIEYKKTVQPIGLATTNFVETGDPCVLSGWGVVKFNGGPPNALQKLNLRVSSQAECQHFFDQVIDSHICALSRSGQGACRGDSGSPLVAKGVQIGLTSFVQSCARGIPDVYTRVSAFKEWIDKHTKLT